MLNYQFLLANMENVWENIKTVIFGSVTKNVSMITSSTKSENIKTNGNATNLDLVICSFPCFQYYQNMFCDITNSARGTGTDFEVAAFGMHHQPPDAFGGRPPYPARGRPPHPARGRQGPPGIARAARGHQCPPGAAKGCQGPPGAARGHQTSPHLFKPSLEAPRTPTDLSHALLQTLEGSLACVYRLTQKSQTASQNLDRDPTHLFEHSWGAAHLFRHSQRPPRTPSILAQKPCAPPQTLPAGLCRSCLEALRISTEPPRNPNCPVTKSGDVWQLPIPQHDYEAHKRTSCNNFARRLRSKFEAPVSRKH